MANRNLVQSLLATLAVSCAIGLAMTETASANSPNGPIQNVNVTGIRVHSNGDLYILLGSGVNTCGSNTYLAGNVVTGAEARSFLSIAQSAYLSGRQVTIWTGACSGSNGTVSWMQAL